MKRVVLVTGHYWQSKRKAGFHWLADAFLRQGWEVVFFTAPISWLSVIRGDYRLEYPVVREANQLQQVETKIWSYVWFTPWHPANLRWDLLNYLASKLFRLYSQFPLGAVEPMIENADLIIFESTPALLLFEKFKFLNPNAKFVYRVSDDLRLLRNHPVVLETEKQISSKFDLVSVPSQYIYKKFAGLPKLQLHLHGIRKDLFDSNYTNPYLNSNCPNIIFVGNSYFDVEFLESASQLFPDWQFHIIGPINNLPANKNIISYGEMPFKDTIPYIKYADIALQIRSYSPGIESLTDSLKVIQYTYCQLPIIAPTYLSSARPHVFYYQPSDADSIQQALISAQNFDRSQIQTDDIYSWDELISKWLLDLYQ
ncbi:MULTISPECIES: glucuronosyltransferase [unclassified Anabaena]|uniref:GumK N-terminal domain-containing glycosyltransferase n=1 Tax=unclassified Anabaena TaxID=2619674 RepID=UPI00082C6313|nr:MULTISPECIES: glucuronosyltransferase [unclassified Anabaena]